MKEIRSLKKDGVTAEELGRSKDHLKGSLMLSLESTSSRMDRLARHEMRFGSFMSIDQMLAGIDAGRLGDPDALGHRVLDQEQLSLMSRGALPSGAGGTAARPCRLKRSSERLIGGLERSRPPLRARALAPGAPLWVGRTQATHAEPMVFGLKAALWYSEAGRNLDRLRRARETGRGGKLSGAGGALAPPDPHAEGEGRPPPRPPAAPRPDPNLPPDPPPP